MAVTVSLPTVLAPLAGGQRTVEAQGQTLGAIVDDVARKFPQLAPRLRDTDGQPYRFVTFYLNDQDCRFLGGFEAQVADGDEVAVVPAIAGG
jgi:molybdopterin synthase sulfur carrier subunit